MNQHAILIDFGSTFTKVAVADLAAGRMVATGRFPSTVRTDARVGLGQCFGLAKEAIAATAATLVDDGDVLVIDIGTTGFYFAKALMDKREITIITGDLAIANYASFNLPNASVVLLGGSVRKGHLYLAGALTLDCMSKLHADKAFVSADGFHPDHGFTVEHDFSAMIKHMYLTNSNQGYMMVDQGKFNKTSFYQSAQIDDLDGIIVDGDDEGIMTAAIESSRSHPKLYIAK